MVTHPRAVVLVDEPDASDTWERELARAGLTLTRTTFRAAADGSALPRSPVVIVVSPGVVEHLPNEMESLRRLSERGELVVIVPANRLFLAAYLVGAGICVARAGVDSPATIARGISERGAGRRR